jgi:hypothetical protein
MLSAAQSNYMAAAAATTAGKDNTAAVEFVSNMLQSEASNYLTNMSTLSHVTKMCSSLSAHWPSHAHHAAYPHHYGAHQHLHHHHHQTSALNSAQLAPNAAAAAAAAAALAAGHNIDAILGASYSVKSDLNTASVSVGGDLKSASTTLKTSDGYLSKASEFNNSYDGKCAYLAAFVGLSFGAFFFPKLLFYCCQ